MKCFRVRREVPMPMDRWVCISLSKKDCSQTIRAISARFQNKPGFVKRIKPSAESLSVLLCKESDFSSGELAEHVSSLGLDSAETFVADVPAAEPKTEAEVKTAQSVWPCAVKCTEVPPEVPDFVRAAVPEISKKREKCAVSCTILESESEGTYTVFSGTKESENIFEHSIIRMVRTVSKSTNGYLCTGKTVVLSGEPCLVCGMALVHGRVKKVYIAGMESSDGPYSRHSIHENKSLNHRIEVYKLAER
ncbi:tRNA-specific adenosine deaminase 3 [Nematocida major]|uniref:tRNA-specific adenosine deaminase 3 n=1 Tax=Nematocida major TaxID=1912982 RepID=UPI002008BFE7|nr:tRNA-specific adenosine deaminase 3 [Nematocida major]KAH9386095.1 tRNA-specific adenosine deaminase 3 [Nematocida major]